ncbi:YhjD/YihY/BrkB family envelope integrity protein [Mycoplasmopsis felis]|uniref:YhjD/YihY/BrkB family envelope integrity protein n=1 Tax=Mycoplasmopsis felis TaxID=33923 RepID=UPI002AFF42AE|nr:YhjD/YihY/BrkB family envelope integrity protein [Mycoplasmopsis felis]WQQ03473.1 YhjD/YihY/BrkB family envelope integrity protein [Mycoplasmopsis felis]WQQ05736.1 YhjD/YihY/BrkB family envelope integrity protein [Mycoplasmopsis felis]WQQ06120.1 YhjD/YihY/BrkB family envelope integrity protein [Mycoplasmopsis felis]WQQ07320.1 YhjD/YihY/BrkB family envelope integrity protein [Mycoplasmopsis felis]WQQ07392.1 YhjD/YihY/BrkB family envelope integrity protein [Mycoplasmopsis felis]
MKNLNNKILNYKKITKRKVPKIIYKEYYENIIPRNPFVFLEKIYEFFIKSIISIFANILIISRTENAKIKRKRVILNIFELFNSKQYNFIWLSITFYMLISFVAVIFIVNFLNLVINDNITTFKNLVSNLVKKQELNTQYSTFQSLFNNIVFNKFIPGGEIFLSLDEIDVSSNFKLYSWIPGSVIALPSLYISAGGYGKLVTAFNTIYYHKKTGTFIGNKLKGLYLVLGISFLLWFFSTLYIFSQASIYNNHQTLSYGLSDFAYLSFIILFFVFSFLFLFKEGPSFKLSYKSIYRGVFVSFLPSLFLVIIYTYLNKILNYSKYGAAVGFFFSIGFFINWYVYFMFLGIVFNSSYYKSYVSSHTIPKKIYSLFVF